MTVAKEKDETVWVVNVDTSADIKKQTYKRLNKDLAWMYRLESVLKQVDYLMIQEVLVFMSQGMARKVSMEIEQEHQKDCNIERFKLCLFKDQPKT